MILSGFLLGTLSTIGAYFIYIKLPKRIKQWILHHQLFSDLTAMVFTYLIFGGGPTVLFAAAFACIETSVILAISKDPELLKILANIIFKVKVLKQQGIVELKGILGENNETK